MGAPKATDTPAAAAADNTSRFFANATEKQNEEKFYTTFVILVLFEQPRENIATTASDMNQRTFLAQGHSRSDRQRLYHNENFKHLCRTK
jgi:hypothetical protein